MSEPGERSGAARPGTRRLSLVIGAFALFASTLYAVSRTDSFQQAVGDPSLALNASLAARLLRLLGEHASAIDNAVVSPRFILVVSEGCDALLPYWVFGAAVLASPVSFAPRLVGLLGGAALLLLVNQLRIVSLYFTGVHAPAAFELMHVEVWQPLYIFFAITLWFLWAFWGAQLAANRR
jgi:exosortase/archaeosortase family protein